MKHSVTCKKHSAIVIDCNWTIAEMAATGQEITLPDETTIHEVPEDSFTRNYEVLAIIGAGAFSQVMKCQKRVTGEIFACKKLHQTHENLENIEEFNADQLLPAHPNVIQLLDCYFEIPTGQIFLIYELMDTDLSTLTRGKLRNEPLQDDQIRSIMSQIMSGIAHLHANDIMHCDLKPENVLINLAAFVVKLGDLGNAQATDSDLPRGQYYVATRWYRPPECLLTNGYYGQEIDIWAAGCIFYELIARRVLFRGRSEVDQINMINRILGPPPVNILQKFYDHGNVERQNQGQASSSPSRQRFQDIQLILNQMYTFRIPLAAASGSEGGAAGQPHLFDKIKNPEAKSLLFDFLQHDAKLRPTAAGALFHAYFKKEEMEIETEE